MTIFAKTFIIDDTQVLVFWEYDPDTEEYEWQFMADLGSSRATIKFRVDREKREEFLELFTLLDEAKARKMLEEVRQTIEKQ